MTSPAISVVVPTYNRQALLPRALASVVAQTFRDFELIVVDDGSTDGTRAWVAEHYPEATLVRLERNVGAAAARNVGVERARGAYLAFLDSDDEWSPEFLQRHVEILGEHPDCAFSYCDFRRPRADGTFEEFVSGPARADDDMVRAILFGGVIQSTSLVVVREAAFREVGGFNPILAVCHDRDLYMRILARRPAVRVGACLVTKHRSKDALTADLELWERDAARLLSVFFASDASRRYRGLERAARLAWSHLFFVFAYRTRSVRFMARLSCAMALRYCGFRL
jgi:glycosyltransferase involved in cell wall biosynthesis